LLNRLYIVVAIITALFSLFNTFCNMRPVIIIALLALFAFWGCKQNDVQKPDVNISSISIKTLSSAIGSAVVRAKITRLQSAGGGKYNYTVSLFVADAASPDVPLRLPGNLTVSGVLTDGKDVQHSFTVTLKAGTTTTNGSYVLPWPVALKGSSSSPAAYNGVPIDFSGTFYEGCTKNYPGMIYDVMLADSDYGIYQLPDITSDADGNAYVFGVHAYAMDVDPGPGVQMLNGAGGFIEKLSPTGALVWAVNLGDLNYAESMQIAVDKNKNVYVDWYVASPNYEDDFELKVAKFDPSGNKLWQNVVYNGSANVDIRPIVPDDDGNLYVGGNALVKYGPGGNIAWQDKLYYSPANSIALSNNKINIWGLINGTVDIDPGTGVFNIGSPDPQTYSDFTASYDTSGRFITAKSTTALPLTGVFAQNGSFAVSYDGTLFRTDADLDLVWQHNFNFYQNLDGTTAAMTYLNFTADINYNSYVCGQFEGSLTFNDSGAPYTLTAKGQNDFIEKRDPAGNFVWAIPLHPFTTSSQIGIIKTDAQGNIYCTGLTRNAAGKFSIFIDKLSQCD
jgi:hypothetical protein